MLLIPVYHHVHTPKCGLHLPAFVKHLEYLIKTYNIVTTEEPLHPQKMNICLTFDDAFFDFYYFVFPLLKKYQMKVILGVPTTFIESDTTLPPHERLEVEGYDGLHQGKSFARNPFCTWRELKEMADSGYVILASHSHQHQDFTTLTADAIREELITSKTLIEKHVGIVPEIFIYPFGRMNRQAYRLVKKEFRYQMRLGHALNKGWTSLMYRVDAEKYWTTETPFSARQLLFWKTQYYVNRLRGR